MLVLELHRRLTMCMASPARVLALDDGMAVVEWGGRTRRASLLVAPEVGVGAWVLVAAGTIVREIDAVEAAALESELRSAIAATSPPPASSIPPSGRAGGLR